MNPASPYHTPRRTPADPLADQLRRAARNSGRSIGHLARDAGIDRRALARLLSGENRYVTTETADAIAEALGARISLVTVARAPRSAKPGRPTTPTPAPTPSPSSEPAGDAS